MGSQEEVNDGQEIYIVSQSRNGLDIINKIKEESKRCVR